MDYLQTGDKDTSSIEFLAWKAEPFWGRPKANLIEAPLKGESKIEVFDASLNELVYLKGFSTLFSAGSTSGLLKPLRKKAAPISPRKASGETRS